LRLMMSIVLLDSSLCKYCCCVGAKIPHLEFFSFLPAGCQMVDRHLLNCMEDAFKNACQELGVLLPRRW
jgi:hypothetical protein